MGSKMTPFLISEVGPLRPPMGATESDTPCEVGLRNRYFKQRWLEDTGNKMVENPYNYKTTIFLQETHDASDTNRTSKRRDWKNVN